MQMPNEFQTSPEIFSILRVLEWISCSVCLGIAIYILFIVPKFHEIVKVLLILASSVYFFLTFMDIVLMWLQKPFTWTSWLMISLMGSLLFFLCVGFVTLTKKPLGVVLFIITIISNTITGLLFFFEIFYILSEIAIPFPKATETKKSSTTTTSANSHKSNFASERNNFTQYSQEQIEVLDLQTVTHEPQQIIQCKKDKLSCEKEHCKKYPKEHVPSHGGTFHVSKDVVPISNPIEINTLQYLQDRPTSLIAERCPRICKKDCDANMNEELTPSSRTTSHRSVNSNKSEIYEFNETNVAPKSRTTSLHSHRSLESKNDIDMKPTARTVAVSVRTVPKFSEEMAKSPKEFDAKSSSPSITSQSSVLNFLPRDYLFTYARCGGPQRCSTFEPLLSLKDSRNIYGYNKLSTVLEDGCCSYSSDEPTKDSNCSPKRYYNEEPSPRSFYLNNSKVSSCQTSPHCNPRFSNRSLSLPEKNQKPSALSTSKLEDLELSNSKHTVIQASPKFTYEPISSKLEHNSNPSRSKDTTFSSCQKYSSYNVEVYDKIKESHIVVDPKNNVSHELNSKLCRNRMSTPFDYFTSLPGAIEHPPPTRKSTNLERYVIIPKATVTCNHTPESSTCPECRYIEECPTKKNTKCVLM